jgi:hypothetical protein
MLRGMSQARDKLLKVAHKRVAAQRSSLTSCVTPRLTEITPDQFLCPEDFSLGYYTPLWDELAEEERLALNHWIYALTYSRIRNGECYVLAANGAIADYLRPHAPAVSALLERESEEERDHIQAFDRARERVCEGIGLGDWPWPAKRGNRLASSGTAVRGLLKTFGPDYVVVYFLGRGLANHMGKGFEQPLAQSEGLCPATQELSLQHFLDESHHMAVSGLMAAAGKGLVPKRRRGPVYRRLLEGLSKTLVRYTFGQSIYKAHETRLSSLALGRMPALARRSQAFRDELVRAHFASTSGLERSRNRVMARPNRRLLDGADLDPGLRRTWERELVAGQGNLRFFADAAA